MSIGSEPPSVNAPHTSPRPSRRRWRAESGFTIVEVLAAASVLIVGMLGTVAMLDGASARTVAITARDAATGLQRELVERSRSIPYPQLTTASLPGQLQALPGLEDASPAPGYQVRRRGFTFTIVLSVCTRDDPKDGLGVHDASFCAGSPAGTQDRNADDYKLVSTDVSWAEVRAHGRARQQTIVNNRGNAAGPGICSISLNAGTNNVITSVLASATLSVCVTLTPAAVTWSVDGEVKGNATGAGAAWSALWPLTELHDGTYLVGARAYDSAGRSGPGRSTSVTLNRFLPLAPGGLVAGRNGSVVELEWLANKERDVVGYRVYRGATAVASCSLTTTTACQDTSPPALALLTYTVVALDRDVAGNLREGVASLPVDVLSLNRRPNPPTGLSAALNANGAVTLTWTPPSPADPDIGDRIAFYRIYRDGTAIGARYDRTGLGTERSYVDARTGGTPHSYWITAVDTQLAESVVVGPVTL